MNDKNEKNKNQKRIVKLAFKHNRNIKLKMERGQPVGGVDQ